MEAYAAENGFKPLEDNPAPNQYYISEWVDNGEKITRVNTPMDLEQVKNMAREMVQENLNRELKVRTEVDCEELGKAIIYDEAALINAMGLEAGDAFITADDSVIVLTETQKNAVKAALKTYRAGLYAAATEKRAQINACSSVDEVAQIAF